jgi:LPPG:FO 2-phospho-L-lactate transferase
VNERPGPKIAALAGGVGAAKFLLGLSGIVPPEQTTIIANTGDDIELFGLHISPDIDTVMYTLAGFVSAEKGWGIEGDTFECLNWIARYGEPAWFNLGDRDLATHLYRSDQLRRGRSLTEVTDSIRRSLGIGARILPMSDQYTPTRVATEEGEMHLQEYFVRRRAEPRVRSIRFDNIDRSRPAPGVEAAILESDAVVLCPSNPFISIGPILAVPGLRQTLTRTAAMVAAVTPIVGGKALKGPAAQMLRDLGHEPTALGVARLYRDFLDLFILDETDSALAPAIEALGLRVLVTDTIMSSLEKKRHLARAVVAALDSHEGHPASH